MTSEALRVHGQVRRDGEPVEAAYVGLHQRDLFVAERRTGPDGTYAFYVTRGRWTLVCRAAGAAEQRREVELADGEVQADFDLEGAG